MCELARNSVLQSGFADEVKREWYGLFRLDVGLLPCHFAAYTRLFSPQLQLHISPRRLGPNGLLDGVTGNDIHKTNVVCLPMMPQEASVSIDFYTN